MGQACSSVVGRCCYPRRHPSVSKPDELKFKQPLVVEDESWKRWSSYHLIHHPTSVSVQDRNYTPPSYVATSQQPAEAVWEV